MRRVLRELPPSPERTVARVMIALRRGRGIRLTNKEIETLVLIRDFENLMKDLKVLEENPL